jgi:hypothetical protein
MSKPCALCLDTNVKLAQSHIVPEFLYKALYDSKHRFQVISTNPSVRNSLEQKGLREPLLCKACEATISVSVCQRHLESV